MINIVLAAWQKHRDRIPSDLRRNFLLDLSAGLLIGVFVAITGSFAPVVARRLGASPFLMAVITAAPYAGNLSTALAAYALQDKPKMPYMVWAWSISRGLFLLLFFVAAPEPFVLIIVAYWVISSLPIPGYAQVMRQIYPDAYRGRAMAYVRIAMTACITALTPVAGWLLDIIGYRYLFPIAGIFGVLSGLIFGRIRLREIISKDRRSFLSIWHPLLNDQDFRNYSLAFFVYGFGNLLIVPLVPIFLVDELYLNYSQVGLLGMINALFWTVFYAVWGRGIDRRGALWTLRVNFFLTLFVPLGFFLAKDIWLVAIAYVFSGITMAGVDLGWINGIMHLTSKERVGDYTALHSSLLGIRGLIAPFLGTLLMNLNWLGLRGVFLISTILIVAGWALILRVGPKARPQRA